MQGRSVALLLALVTAGIAAVVWIAMQDPEAPAPAGGGTVEHAAAPPVAQKSAADPPKRTRASAGPRWVRRGAGVVAGRVREYGTDRPLGGIALSIEAGSPGPDRTLDARTAADGSFVIDGVDEFDVDAPREGAGATRRRGARGIRVRTGSQTDVGTVYLAPAFAVPGIVVDDRGAPVEGADVLAARRSATDPARSDVFRVLRELTQRPATIDRTTTGADGRFRLTKLVPGTYDIAAQRTGFATAVEEAVLVTPASAGEEVRIVVRKGLEVRGRVTRRGGTPAAGVAIVAFTEPRGSALFDPLSKVFAATDATGAFRLEGLAAGRYILAATPDGEPSAINEKIRVPTTAPIEITLEGDAALEGTVTGPDDKPVAGAHVLVVCEKAKAFASAVTGEAGQYAFKGLASGQPTLLVVDAEGLARHPADVGSALKGGRGAETTLVPGTNRKDVKLEGGATVRGTVREKDSGAAASGVRVQVLDTGMGKMGSARGATTDESGRYSIAGIAPGTVVLTLSKEGWYQPDLTQDSFAPMMRMAESGPGPGPGTGPMVVVAEGATLVERDLEIVRTGTIRGRVEAPDGTPAAGAQVSIVPDGRDDFMSSMTSTGIEPRLTDAAGMFSMPAPAAGRPVRVVAKRSGLAAGRSEPITGTGGADVDAVVVRLRLPAVVEGLVADSAGKPVDGAVIRWTAPGMRDGTTTTGADGRWRTSGVEPATYALQFTHPRFLPFAVKESVVEEGKSVTVDAVLTLGAVVAGKVLGPDGAPVAGAFVDLQPKGRRVESFADMGRDPVVSGPDGSFRAEGLAPGGYAASARAEGFVPSDRADVDAPADVVILRLAQAFTISGVVRVRGGGPVAGVDVRASAPRPGGTPAGALVPAPAMQTADGKVPAAVMAKAAAPPTFAATGRTDADGRFVVKGLPAGAYDLRVDPDSSRSGRPNVLPFVMPGVAAGQGDVAVEMEPGFVISGQVFVDGGGPAAKGRVSCAIERQPGAPQVEGGRGNATIAEGRFEIVGLAPGTYDLSVSVDEYAPKRIKTASGATGLRIEMSRGGAISGRALLPDGTAAAGATVNVNSSAGNGNAKTDADGRFTVRLLAEGSYDVTVWMNRDQALMRHRATDVAVRDGAPTELGDVTLVKVEKPAPAAGNGRVPIPVAPPPPPK